MYAAHQRAWTGSERLCGSYSAESLVRVVMVISIISWRAFRGGGRRRHCDHRVRLHQRTEDRSEELQSHSAEGRRRLCASAEEDQQGSSSTEDCPARHCRCIHCPRRPPRPGPIRTFQAAKLNTFRPAPMTTSRLDRGAWNKAYMSVTDPMIEVPHKKKA